MKRYIKIIKFAIFIAVVYLIINIGWQYISMNINRVEMKGEIKEFLYGKVRIDEYEVKDRILKFLLDKGINLQYDELFVTKPTTNSLIIQFTYTDSIIVPVVNKVFYFMQEIETSVKSR